MNERRRLEKLLTMVEKLAATDPRAAYPGACQAWETAQRRNDIKIVPRARRILARTMLFTGDPREAYRHLCTARVESAAVNDVSGVATCDHFLGIALEFMGDPGGSALHLEAALRSFQAAGDSVGQAYTLSALGNAARAAGHLKQALDLHSQAAELAHTAGDRVAHSSALVNCGQVRGLLGVMAAGKSLTDAAKFFSQAVVDFRRAAQQARYSNDSGREPVALAGQVLPLVWLGRVEEASACASAALEAAGKVGLDHRLASALQAAGLACVVKGDFDGAITHLDHALSLYDQWELTYDTSAVLRLLVEAYEKQGKLAEALLFHKRLTIEEIRLQDAIAMREELVVAARLESDRARRLDDKRRIAERLAHTDALTGLANRRHFEAQTVRALIQAELVNEPLSIVLMDIDHFKRINDEHGHVVGDRVLCEVALELVRQCRLADLACRLGGEEFIVLLPGVGRDDAKRIAERLRNSFSVLDLSRFVDGLTITVSAGVAFTDADSSRPAGPETAIAAVHALVAAADEALYRAKEGGRDRVCLAGAASP